MSAQGLDLQEAVDFAARRLVAAEIEPVPFAAAAEALARLRAGPVAGRLVLKYLIPPWSKPPGAIILRGGWHWG